MRAYLSWSQYSLWTRSKSEYIKKYFEGKETFVTKEMNFGSSLHTLLETSLPPELQHLENTRREIKYLESVEWVPVMSIVDGISEKTEIVEYKTGKTPWTQERANNHGQIVFEYIVMTKANEEPSREAFLYWFETQNEWNGIELTGNIQEFKVHITDEMIAYWTAEIVKTWEAIKQAHHQWETGEIDVRALKRFELAMQIEEIEKQIAEIDAEVLADLQAGKVVACPQGKYYSRTTKTISYPDTPEIKAKKEAYTQREAEWLAYKAAIEAAPEFSNKKSIFSQAEAEWNEYKKSVEIVTHKTSYYFKKWGQSVSE